MGALFSFRSRIILLAAATIGLVSAVSWQPAFATEFPTVDQLPSVPQMPSPLMMFDGTPVTTVEQWETSRKPELKGLFQHYMYGYMPAAPAITATVREVDHDLFGGKATMKQVTIAYGPPECPKMDLLLVVPNHVYGTRPPPVILGLNSTGNHSVLNDPRIAIPQGWMPDFSDAPDGAVVNNRATEVGRGFRADRWQISHAIDRGYAVATFWHGDLMPDKNDFTDGVGPYFLKPGQTERAADDWGALAMWAWGFERAVDYLATDRDVDARRIVAYGHSRNGKAALLAGAMDNRIAAVIPHQAGCAGSNPSRRETPGVQSIAGMNGQFPHWCNDVFKTFNNRETRLPFDQNSLVGLCAPRPVLFTCGEQDPNGDPPGTLHVLKAADPVYQLYGRQGIADDAVAVLGQTVGSSLCYYDRNSGHTVDRVYWDAFLDFADRQLSDPGLLPAVTLVDKNATWKYLHPLTGVDPGVGSTFMQPGFNDSSWSAGAGPLGYGQTDHAGFVATDIGKPASGSRYTSYYRTTFSIADPALYSYLIAKLARDDGAVVYLNGHELFRDNVAGGSVAYTTPAAPDTITGDAEIAYTTFSNLTNWLIAGTNVLAVEVHQAEVTSSDLSFDLALLATEAAPIPDDTNHDGKVDTIDAETLAANWGESGGWCDGDFNGDGMINAADASILAANWGDYTGEAAAAVPEPSALTLRGMWAIGFLFQIPRRRQ